MANVDMQPGDNVTIITKTSKEEGILIPSPDKSVVILKLKTGYNQGFDAKNVKEITLVEKAKTTVGAQKKVVKNKDLPTIAILIHIYILGSLYLFAQMKLGDLLPSW